MADILKGPRPLSLHFSNSQIIWTAAAESLPYSLQRGLWHGELRQQIRDLKQQLETVDNEKFMAAVSAGAAERKKTFLTGINSYVAKEYVRPDTQADVCHTAGTAKLYDYGGGGQPILLVPSLINPYYILDLMPGRSVAHALKERGYRPFLMDWGNPGATEMAFGLDDYILLKLKPMLEHVAALAGGAVPLMGYCMGGTLSLALTACTHKLVSKLMLLAAPWNFEISKPHAGRRYVPQMLRYLDKLPEEGTVAVEMLQMFFASVDPTLNDQKFRSYAAGKYQGSDAEFFSAMEIWANNSAPLSRRVAWEAMKYWYQNNDTYRERWHVGGQPVRLSNVRCPVFVAAPPSDRLVPEESALSVLEKVQDAVSIAPPSGHIGMVVGNRAKEGLLRPMFEWLKDTSHAA